MSKYYISNYGYADPMYLEHYGVLGMKWGIRKDRKLLNNAIKTNYKIRQNSLDKAYKKGKISKKDHDALSNKLNEARKSNQRQLNEKFRVKKKDLKIMQMSITCLVKN